MKILIVTCFLLLISATTKSQDLSNFHECLEKDSISCVQIAVFRKAREFFEQPSVSVFGGVSFAKNPEIENTVEGKSLESSSAEQAVAIESANTVEDRETALESYMITKAKNFFQERSLTWDYVSASRSISSAIPDDIKESVRSLLVESRGKKKKILKKLLPLLGLVKIKFAVLGVLALLAIGFIAKKALITSLLSIALSGGILLKKILQKKLGGGGGGGGGGGHEETIIAYNAGGSGGGGGWSSGGGGGSGGWSNGGGGGGWSNGGGGGYDSYGGDYGGHGSHSSPVGQAVAYQGHKVARR